MNFSFCESLRKFPDVSRIPNLQKLTLEGCTNLVEIHPSVGSHDKLVILRLEGCSNLTSFSRSLKMRSLKFLWLQGCLKLKNFPEIQCRMECLTKIDFTNTSIKELPSSIGYLVGIKTLNLSSCTKLTNLPNSIHKLQHLEILSIGGVIISKRNFRDTYHLFLIDCSKVAELFKIVEDRRHSMPTVASMEESATSSTPELFQSSPLTDTSDSNDGCSSMLFPKLQILGFENCDLSELNIFRTFDWFSTLTSLEIVDSDIVTLPPCIRRFVSLKCLSLWKCKQLREILGLPPNVAVVLAYKCVSLTIFLEEGRILSQLFNTPEALFQVGTIFPPLILGNNVLPESDFLIQRDCPSSLKYLILLDSAIVSLPIWLNRFVGLEYLYLGGCKQLREIPELPPTLRGIDLSDCHGLPKNIGADMQIHLMSEVCTSLPHTHTHIRLLTFLVLSFSFFLFFPT
jgi:Leucine-rich repeat (LRR) protein